MTYSAKRLADMDRVERRDLAPLSAVERDATARASSYVARAFTVRWRRRYTVPR